MKIYRFFPQEEYGDDYIIVDDSPEKALKRLIDYMKCHATIASESSSLFSALYYEWESATIGHLPGSYIIIEYHENDILMI
jgi:hypothetical protein